MSPSPTNAPMACMNQAAVPDPVPMVDSRERFRAPERALTNRAYLESANPIAIARFAQAFPHDHVAQATMLAAALRSHKGIAGWMSVSAPSSNADDRIPARALPALIGQCLQSADLNHPDASRDQRHALGDLRSAVASVVRGDPQQNLLRTSYGIDRVSTRGILNDASVTSAIPYPLHVEGNRFIRRHLAYELVHGSIPQAWRDHWSPRVNDHDAHAERFSLLKGTSLERAIDGIHGLVGDCRGSSHQARQAQRFMDRIHQGIECISLLGRTTQSQRMAMADTVRLWGSMDEDTIANGLPNGGAFRTSLHGAVLGGYHVGIESSFRSVAGVGALVLASPERREPTAASLFAGLTRDRRDGRHQDAARIVESLARPFADENAVLAHRREQAFVACAATHAGVVPSEVWERVIRGGDSRVLPSGIILAAAWSQVGPR